jgi:hypothetical protein
MWSHTYKNEYLKNPKYERAEVVIGSLCMKRISESRTYVSIHSLSDVKLPQTLVNTTNKEVARSLKYLKDVLEAR